MSLMTFGNSLASALSEFPEGNGETDVSAAADCNPDGWRDAAEDIAQLVAWGLTAGAEAADVRADLSPTGAQLLCDIDLLHIPEPETLVRRIAHRLAEPVGQPVQASSPVGSALPTEDGAHPRPYKLPPVDYPCTGLGAFSQVLRDYQQDVLDDATRWLADLEAGRIEDDAWRRLYSCPTGTGKGTMELALLKQLRGAQWNAWILTPSLEVLRGFLERCGHTDIGDCSTEKLAALGEAIFVTTPTRMRNRILEGERQCPDVVLYDEVHHAIEGSDVSGTLFAVAPDAAWLGFTATPYRGSPNATVALREAWGDPIVVLTIPEAVAAGYQALPTFEVVPLVDDDEITVRGGKFIDSSASEAVGSRVGDLAKLIAQRFQHRPAQEAGTVTEAFATLAYERRIPTAIAVPSSEVASALVEALDTLGVDSCWVSQSTKAPDRAKAYVQCSQGEIVLISIRTLNEGMDFPWLGRIIDARPTLSPVAWLQLIGREMRVKLYRPEYITVCRNLERFAYLMQGAIPRETFLEAQNAFEVPSKRSGARQIGLEHLRRFKGIELPLDGGAKGTMYSLYSVDKETGVKTEYVTLLDPCSDEAFCALRAVQPAPPMPEGADRRPKRPASAYGKWTRGELPEGLVGFATSRASKSASDKQMKQWRLHARRVGLDADATDVTGRQADALFVLLATRHNMLSGGAA